MTPLLRILIETPVSPAISLGALFVLGKDVLHDLG